MSITGTAIIQGDYRYRLSRTWGEGQRVLWIMLNPSTADASRDDVTIRKCIGFSMRWGAAGIDVVNLFAFRSTYPHSLETAPDPVGPLNDAYLAEALREPTRWRTVAAWGCDPHLWARDVLRQRPAHVARLIANEGHPLFCLGATGRGSPRHPSRLAYATPLALYDEVAA